MVSTSFGIQSAVTLHMATRVLPDIPVVWVDTGYLPTETYQYADELAARLNLNLHVYQPLLSPARMEATYGQLWTTGSIDDMNRYDEIRKVEPMHRALRELAPAVWISGLRGEQTSHRKTLRKVAKVDGRAKILPILDWSSRDVYQYMVDHDLPQHPLWAQGYTTVGDWHSSRAVSVDDDNDRVTRFQGIKEECGIHL